MEMFFDDTVGEQVRIATDRGGEMDIVGKCQAKVPLCIRSIVCFREGGEDLSLENIAPRKSTNMCEKSLNPSSIDREFLKLFLE